MRRKAIIDIGSNSVKLLLCEGKADGRIARIIDESVITRLGERLHETGVLDERAMLRSARAVADFSEKARENGADEIVCVGTMALRTAKNSGEFVRMVSELCGAGVRVIPGEEEARLSYLAVLSALPLTGGDIAVFDTGGGSTEFIYGRGADMVRRFSVDIGAVRIAEKYCLSGVTPPERIAAAMAEADRCFENAGVSACGVLAGLGGNVTAMSAVKQKMSVYDSDAIQGSTLTLDDIEEQIRLYGSLDEGQRRAIAGIPLGRADIILAGACIVSVIMKKTGAPSLTVSARGLRHGLAFDIFSRDGRIC